MSDEEMIQGTAEMALEELKQLTSDPVWAGRGVPHGDGQLVFPIPGMFGNWIQMQPMYGWLQRMGYEPSRAVVSLDRGCGLKLAPPTEMALIGATKGRPRKVAIIAHSAGGFIGRALAARLGKQVTHLILLGTPIRAAVGEPYRGGGESDERIAAARRDMEESWAKVQEEDPSCSFPTCNCSFVQDLRRDLHPSTKVLSIYSTTDPSNSAWCCHLDRARNRAVTGTHIGLIFNREVYREIALFLAGKVSAGR